MPFKQGDLDGLCGVYSIANALDYLDIENGEDVFEHIIKYMQRKFIFIREYIIDGLKDSTVNRLLQEAKTVFNFKFSRHEGNNIVTTWNMLTDSIDDNTCAIIELGGRHEHWTVVKSITDKRINLIDSGGLQHIDRNDFGHDNLHQIHSFFIITR
jgi:hypothetical protein